jgi:hypothetical protein
MYQINNGGDTPENRQDMEKTSNEWTRIGDRLYEIDQALNVYPLPVRQKRLIRTT